MSELDLPPKLGIKIERPKSEERVSLIYYVFLLISFMLMSLALWVLVLEFRGDPLPHVLKFSLTA